MLFHLSILISLLLSSLVLAGLYNSYQTFRKFKHLPWMGMKSHHWWLLNYVRVKNFMNLRRDFKSISEEYWNKGQACFIPMLLGDFLIVPPVDFEWMLEQSDESLDIHNQLVETTQAEHTLMSKYTLDYPTHQKTISRDLTRRLGDLTQDIVDELALSIDAEWGTDTVNWNEINPFTTLIKVVARTSNRVFVGPPLCRNPDFIDSAISFASSVIPSAWLLSILPPGIKSLAAPLILHKNHKYRRQLKNHLKPEIQARLTEASSPEKRNIETHNDFLQWTINAAFKSDLPRESEIDVIADRLLLTNFAAIHTSTISITNAIYDLTSRPSSQEIITTLRDEATSILTEHNGTWTKTALAQMTKIDSALKESARIGQLSAFSFQRRVEQPGGLTTPVSGTYLPKGTTIAVPVQMIHRDPKTYPDPNTYNPYRFADLRSSMSTDTTSGLKASALPYPTTSPQFLTFSHGRHGCPGRFFASNELKLLMAYVVRHYDFEILEQRPEMMWVGNSIVCPMDKTIKVRRRKDVA